MEGPDYLTIAREGNVNANCYDGVLAKEPLRTCYCCEINTCWKVVAVLCIKLIE